MPAPVAIVNVERIRSTNRLHAAIRHNLRAVVAELSAHGDIDTKRTHLNRVLAGPSEAPEVIGLHRQLLDDAQPTPIRKDGRRAKMRHDAVAALELVISVPPGAVADEAAFFDDALAWIGERFGVPILSAVWHRDQGCEHVHCLLLPVKEGRMVGSGLAGRYDQMHDNFYRQVGQKHGLARKLRLDARSRKAAAQMVMDGLDANPALLQDPAFRATMRALIERDPVSLLEAAGLIQARPPEKEWLKTMTRSVPASKPVGFGNDGPAVAHAGPQGDRTLSCVRDRCGPPPVEGHASPAAADRGDGASILAGEAWLVLPIWQLGATGSVSPAPLPIPSVLDAATGKPVDDDSDEDDFMRVHDDQVPAAYWDGNLGEFMPPSSPIFVPSYDEKPYPERVHDDGTTSTFDSFHSPDLVRDRDDAHPAVTWDSDQGCHVELPPARQSNQAMARGAVALALKAQQARRSINSNKEEE